MGKTIKVRDGNDRKYKIGKLDRNTHAKIKDNINHINRIKLSKYYANDVECSGEIPWNLNEYNYKLDNIVMENLVIKIDDEKIFIDHLWVSFSRSDMFKLRLKGDKAIRVYFRARVAVYSKKDKTSYGLRFCKLNTEI